jgi:hypothetical protein
MHYRNGREAKNGDKILQIGFDGQINALGILHSATPGNDHCNGVIAPIQELEHHVANAHDSLPSREAELPQVATASV